MSLSFKPHNTRRRRASMESFPDETIVHILAFVKLFDLPAVLSLNKRINQLSDEFAVPVINRHVRQSESNFQFEELEYDPVYDLEHLFFQVVITCPKSDNAIKTVKWLAEAGLTVNALRCIGGMMLKPDDDWEEEDNDDHDMENILNSFIHARAYVTPLSFALLGGRLDLANALVSIFRLDIAQASRESPLLVASESLPTPPTRSESKSPDRVRPKSSCVIMTRPHSYQDTALTIARICGVRYQDRYVSDVVAEKTTGVYSSLDGQEKLLVINPVALDTTGQLSGGRDTTLPSRRPQANSSFMRNRSNYTPPVIHHQQDGIQGEEREVRKTILHQFFDVYVSSCGERSVLSQ